MRFFLATIALLYASSCDTNPSGTLTSDEKKGELAGIVHIGGEHVEGVSVVVSGENNERSVVSSDSLGVFQTDPLPLGIYHLSLFGPEEVPLGTLSAEVSRKDLHLFLSLDLEALAPNDPCSVFACTGKEEEGVVRNERGSGEILGIVHIGNRPLSQASVTVVGDQIHTIEAQTDPLGAFAIGPLPPGEYQLVVVRSDSLLQATIPIELGEGDDLTTFLKVDLLAESRTQPCQNLSCDSAVVQNILEAHQVDSLRWDQVGSIRDGRIVGLQLDQDYQTRYLLPAEVQHLTELETLSVNVLGENGFPPQLGLLSSLRSLKIFTRFKKLPEAIRSLTKLEVLKIRCEVLPGWIGELKNLERLEIDNGLLVALPESLSELKKLEYLDAHDNELSQLPHSFTKLKSLVHLNLSANVFTHVPHQIDSLNRLLHLDLSSNWLTSLDYSLTNSSNLTDLFLEGNRISKFPPILMELSNLKRVSLHRNRLCGLSESARQWLQRHQVEPFGEQNCTQQSLPKKSSPTIKWKKLSPS